MRPRPLAGILCAVTVLASACGGGASPAGSGDGTFTMAIPADPGNLDPMQAELVATGVVLPYAYDRLVYFESDGTASPWVAEKWEITPTSVTYTIKDGVTCGDGTAMTATAVAANFTHAVDPAIASAYLGSELQSGTTATADEAARTVTITAPKADSFLLQNTASVYLVCPGGLADQETLARGADGTGLYELTEAVADDHYTFVKRDDYAWGPRGISASEAGLPKTVTLRVITNETTAANLLISGEINAATMRGADLARVEQQDFFSAKTSRMTGSIFFNQRPGRVAADPAVRRALAMALDLEQLGEVQTDGEGTAATGLVALDPRPCTGDPVTGHVPSYDPDAAAELLDEAGWVVGSDGIRVKDGAKLTMKFIYDSSAGEPYDAAAELLVQAWTKLGVDATAAGSTPTALSPIIFESGEWDAGWITFQVNLPSTAMAYVSGPIPPDGLNLSAIDNPDYVRLTAEASALTGDEACEKWEAAEVALFDAVNIVPYANGTTSTFGQGAEFELSLGNVVPATIRLTA